jgi:hypothetical protein
MILASINVTDSPDQQVGYYFEDSGPRVWFRARGVRLEENDLQPDKPIPDDDTDLFLHLSVHEASALSTLLDQSILECLGARGKAN